MQRHFAPGARLDVLGGVSSGLDRPLCSLPLSPGGSAAVMC